MKKHLQPLTPAALYARVSSDRQDVDLSVSAHLLAIKDDTRGDDHDELRFQYAIQADGLDNFTALGTTE